MSSMMSLRVAAINIAIHRLGSPWDLFNDSRQFFFFFFQTVLELRISATSAGQC